MDFRYILAPTLVLTGCALEKAGPPQSDFQVIEREDTESVRVSLNMGAGDLRIGSGTQKLMRADFAFNVPAWKPEVKFHRTGKHGSLTINQPSTRRFRGNTKYEWDIRLNREVALDLNVHFGAGEATLDLGSLDLRGVDVNMGVGSLRMDLRGRPKHDYSVRIHGGVGEATVRLPTDVAVSAEAHGGIGEISAPGLRREGQRYYNEAYGHSQPTIHLEVRGGVGAIRLISD